MNPQGITKQPYFGPYQVSHNDCLREMSKRGSWDKCGVWGAGSAAADDDSQREAPSTPGSPSPSAAPPLQT